jgi:hypothetical protein
LASTTVFNREKAVALQEAIQTIVDLLGEDSARLGSAQHDVVGRQMPDLEAARIGG